MEVVSKKVVDSFSEEDTKKLAATIANEIGENQIIALIGDLGVGKTAFTHGFGDGLGITEPISSPTFTIVQEYDDGRLPLYHFDVYRIEEYDELLEAGIEDILYGDGMLGPGVVLIEWADLIEEELPNHMRITIEKDLEKGFDYRKITIEEVLA